MANVLGIISLVVVAIVIIYDTITFNRLASKVKKQEKRIKELEATAVRRGPDGKFLKRAVDA